MDIPRLNKQMINTARSVFFLHNLNASVTSATNINTQKDTFNTILTFFLQVPKIMAGIFNKRLMLINWKKIDGVEIESDKKKIIMNAQ